MTRRWRFLSAATNATTVVVEAPPPEAVTLESDFVVILAALLCALICVVGLIAVARCAWLRRGSVGGGGFGGARSPGQASANKGLKKKVLQSLPKFTYSNSDAAAAAEGAESIKMATECAICLGEFAEGEEIRILPQCGHSFHVGCIDTWLGCHSSCPSCRQILVVGRCQKCGQFPAVAGGGATSRSESQMKAREDVYNSATSHTSIGFLP